MSITKLTVNNVRIISHAKINPCRGINLIYGTNAAGKTSLLEAIDCLSRGRSFRSSHLKDLITHGQSQLVVAASVTVGQGRQIQLGIGKSNVRTNLRVQGKRPDSISELASLLPVQVMHANGPDLIQGSPKQRRSFIDWGVFHVKHNFLELWRRYQKALLQRNMLLKQRTFMDTVSFWQEELTSAATAIDEARRNYLARLAADIQGFTQLLLNASDVKLDYFRGWSANHELSDLLLRNLETDTRKGFTSIGPHTADLQIQFGNKLASRILSRGQKKMLVAALRMAQISLFNRTAKRACIFLIDDLPSELDESNQERFISGLKKLNIQVFMTAIASDFLKVCDWEEQKLFHVKHGVIEEIVNS